MGSKLSPVIIVVLVVVIIVLGVFMYTTLKTPSKQPANPGNAVPNDPGVSEDVEGKKPTLNLSKETEGGEYPSKVIINVEAAENEGNAVETIVLPDGTTIEGTTAEYIVDQNGTYDFTATCVDGSSETLSIDVTEIAAISANNPYVPAGFTVVEGTTVETGYTIEDEYGNQYVWIPIENGKISETRTTLLNGKYEETSTAATALVNSVAKYYGFYLARFEASKYNLNGETVAASMEGKTPWADVTFQEASDASDKSASAFGYEDCSTGLISSYAWDSTLAWIDTTVQNFSSSIEYGNYSGSLYATGASVRDIFNNICDLCGNVREWTTEIYKQSEDEQKSNKDGEFERRRVIRSASATLNRTVASRQGYAENLTEPYWGFRMVLYKY